MPQKTNAAAVIIVALLIIVPLITVLARLCLYVCGCCRCACFESASRQTVGCLGLFFGLLGLFNEVIICYIAWDDGEIWPGKGPGCVLGLGFMGGAVVNIVGVVTIALGAKVLCCHDDTNYQAATSGVGQNQIEMAVSAVPPGPMLAVAASVAPPVPAAMLVTVPAGMAGGQMIQIATPSGQQMQVQIPAGMVDGQQFQVMA
jgi:hypothetical protein